MVDVDAITQGKSPEEIIEIVKTFPAHRVLRAGETTHDNVRADYSARPHTPLWRTEEPKLDLSDPRNPVVLAGGMWEPQRLCYQSLSEIVALVGGYGVGKTTVGVKKTIAASLTNNGVPSAAIAPTIAASNRYHVPVFEQFFEGKGIPYTWIGGNKRMFRFKYRGAMGRIFCLSGHRPEAIVGDNWGFVWLDEPFIMKQLVFKNAYARMRDPKAVIRQMFLTGTPEQLDWGYELCVNGYEGLSPYVVVAPTVSNKALAFSYMKTLLGIMDERMFKAYFLGQFINLSKGIVYYGFDEDRNLKDLGDLGLPLHVGMDFNVNPMSAVVGWVNKGHLHIFDEIRLPNADTPYMCEVLREKYGDRIEAVYPDPSGARRSATAGASGRTDHQAIQQFGWEVRAPGMIKRRDSENAMNFAMRPMSGPPKVSLYGPGTKKLRGDLLALDHENYKKHDDAGRTHMPDAMKYLVHWHFPPIRPTFEPVTYGV